MSKDLNIDTENLELIRITRIFNQITLRLRKTCYTTKYPIPIEINNTGIIFVNGSDNSKENWDRKYIFVNFDKCIKTNISTQINEFENTHILTKVNKDYADIDNIDKTLQTIKNDNPDIYISKVFEQIKKLGIIVMIKQSVKQ